ncbi:MAG: hydroxymethylglutaryl-CoA lyase [Cytophagaceae bacterium]|nr:hydroxymethylglutaryl-CoA lyase [Cytophagaceae bacterium]
MSVAGNIKLIECPRDAMQGLKEIIPAKEKIRYINSLLKVGFNTIDFGSFVSHTAVPQMKDTAEVLAGLDLSSSKSKLLAIIANVRGAEDAVKFPEISFLGFPLSVSETFQKKNTNKTIEEAFQVVDEIQNLCTRNGKEQVVYLSMGFGNPYGDPYDKEYLVGFVERLNKMGVRIISLSDTIGVSDKENIHYLFSTLVPKFPHIEFGAHLHSLPEKSIEKINAAYRAGCKRFDGAIKGFGGCPMAKDDLVGNIATENLISYFKNNNVNLSINDEEFKEALMIAGQIFPM